MSSDIPSIDVKKEDSAKLCLDESVSEPPTEESASFTHLSSEESTFSLKDLKDEAIDDQIPDEDLRFSDTLCTSSEKETDSEKTQPAHEKSPKSKTKDVREGSPFKEAIRGYVLSKLTKKSETQSHFDSDKKNLFSGIKEKIVKKLEDSSTKEHGGKEVHIATESIDAEVVTVNPVDCELKSVVANDRLDATVVEEAEECFEETKLSPTSSNGISINNAPSEPNHTLTSRSRTMSNLASSLLRSKTNTDMNFSMSFSDLQRTVNQELDEEFLESLKSPISPVPEVPPLNVALPGRVYTQQERVHGISSSQEVEQNGGKLGIGLERLRKLFSEGLRKYFRADILILILAIFTYYFLYNWPLLCGFLCGILGCLFIILFYFEYTNFLYDGDSVQSFYKSLPRSSVPYLLKRKAYTHEGWMNLLNSEYDPNTYKVTDTVSVFVHVDAGKMIMSYPKKNVPRRAMWNEKKITVHYFLREDIYSLCDAKILLLPDGLRPSRVWNKRYPICIIFSKQENVKVPALDADAKLEDGPDSGAKPGSSNSSQSNTPVHGPSERNVLYLFSRTDREKEEWYWKFYHAVHRDHDLTDACFNENESVTTMQILEDSPSPMNASTSLKSRSTSSAKEHDDITKAAALHSPMQKPVINFDNFMDLLMRRELHEAKAGDPDDHHVHWLNVFLGRLFFDIFIQKKWTDITMQRIQMKLDKIKMPQYMHKLVVTDVYLGTSLPQVTKGSGVSVDERGLWLDFDVNYQGYFQMTLETKLKTNKFRQSTFEKLQGDDTLAADNAYEAISDDISEYWDDDEDYQDSETSKEDSPSHQGTVMSTGTKLLHSVEKWVGTGTLSENSFVKRCVGHLIQARLLLTVEIDSISGALAINLPPRPSNRLWYGFRTNPKLSLNVFPKVGERQINLHPVTQFIKRKLIEEFQKAVVMPNMDDLVIPFMDSAMNEQ